MNFVSIISMKLPSIQLLLILIFFSASCSKENECDDPIDCLPPITQKGANTAGCLVDGKVFLPGGQGINTGSVLRALYKFSEDDTLFGLSITNNNSGNRMVFLEVKNQLLVEGNTYQLKDEDSKKFGSYFNGVQGFVTNETYQGELVVYAIDTEKRIISGAFWFDAVDNSGNVIEVRNGRFDVLFYSPN